MEWIVGKFTAVKMFARWIEPASIREAVWEIPSDDAEDKFGQTDEKVRFKVSKNEFKRCKMFFPALY